MSKKSKKKENGSITVEAYVEENSGRPWTLEELAEDMCLRICDSEHQWVAEYADSYLRAKEKFEEALDQFGYEFG